MDKYFAVTDHHKIIPLKIIKREEVELDKDDIMVQIETEVVGEASSYIDCHHRMYFKELWLDDNGLPDKGNVFANEKDAVEYALKKAFGELTRKQNEVNAIQKQISKLMEV